MRFNRRQVLSSGVAAGAALALPFGAQARQRTITRKKIVFVFLRGALDGLAAAPAYGDPMFERARAGLALPPPGSDGGALDLDGFFGLNPLLPEFHAAYRRGELLVVHAVASSYRQRSHFDAQNLVENGTDAPSGAATGWLNRALEAAGARGVSLTSATPLLMRGPGSVTSWSPSNQPQPRDNTLHRLDLMYQRHPQLLETFAAARRANALAGDPTGGGDFPTLMERAADFLSAEDGPSVAFLESHGWDTHAGQSGDRGALWRGLRSIDLGLAAFREAAGPAWDHSAVVFFTEFGRTVAMNGTNGTDHGTGGAVLIAGGGVAGGRVVADWPGLRPSDLLDVRDLRPTLELNSVFSGLIAEPLQLSERALRDRIFPDTHLQSPLEGLWRTA